MTAFVLNTNVLQLTGLQNELTGAYINNATVTITTIEDEGGVGVFPLSGSPITMDYVTGSDGDYRGTLDSTLPFTAGDCYRAHIDVTSGSSVSHYEFPFTPLTRTVR